MKDYKKRKRLTELIKTARERTAKTLTKTATHKSLRV
jgi:hypothetical protein